MTVLAIQVEDLVGTKGYVDDLHVLFGSHVCPHNMCYQLKADTKQQHNISVLAVFSIIFLHFSSRRMVKILGHNLASKKHASLNQTYENFGVLIL